MTYKLLLWDFDGTLADTLTLALGIYNRVAQEKGFVRVDDPHAVRDMSTAEFLAAHRIPAHRIPQLFAIFLTEIRARATFIGLQPGIAQVLPEICSIGVRQGIVSSNSTRTIECCLKANAAAHHFHSIHGTSRLLGKERGIRNAVRKLRLPLSDVLYVGDEIRDIQAARAAGIDIAAVTWGMNAQNALASHQPNYLISNPNQLLDLLNDG